MTTENNDQSSEPADSDNLAIDGLLREYARTGGPGDNESLIASINIAVQSSVAGFQRERDWPWLFSQPFLDNRSVHSGRVFDGDRRTLM